jgi:ubiquinone/menaquinone biosynthesis C-methylase UbiE
MSEAHRRYLPAAGHDWSLLLYDPLMTLLGANPARRALVSQADLEPGHRVLEVGCGTGTLLLMIAEQHAGVSVIGLDPDPRALARARHKAAIASRSIRLDRGFADALPYADGSFDRVLSSFMFHHLADSEERQQTLREIRRVLKPGGRLELLDFSTPDSNRLGATGWLHAGHQLQDNTESRLRSLIASAGFADARMVRRSKLAGMFHTAYFQGTVAAEGRRV